MARVKCKACGKGYDYHEHGCCPGCGAYNRPPRRDGVKADGTVYHISDGDFWENREKRPRSMSGKVCFEQKECHEDVARTVRTRDGYDADDSPFSHKLQQTVKKRNTDHGSNRGKVVAGVVIAIVMANLLPLLLTMCSVSDVTGGYFEEVRPDRPVQVPAVPVDGQEYEITMGGKFLWWDEEACVTEVVMDETDEGTKLELMIYRAELFDEPLIYYYLPDGTQVEATCEHVVDNDNDIYTYYYFLPDRQPDSKCWALFTGYNSDVWCEFTLPLTLTQTSEEVTVELGEWFTVGDVELMVEDVSISQNGSVADVEVWVQQSDFGYEILFYYTTEDGGLESRDYQSYVGHSDSADYTADCDAVTYRFKAKKMDMGAPCYVQISDIWEQGDVVRIPLN